MTLGEWKNWIKAEVPAAPVFWIASYEVRVDAVIGLPVFEHSQAAKKAIAKGLFEKITDDRAQELNEKFASEGDFAVEFLKELLAARWEVIRRQFDECIANG